MTHRAEPICVVLVRSRNEPIAKVKQRESSDCVRAEPSSRGLKTSGEAAETKVEHVIHWDREARCELSLQSAVVRVICCTPAPP